MDGAHRLVAFRLVWPRALASRAMLPELNAHSSSLLAREVSSLVNGANTSLKSELNASVN